MNSDAILLAAVGGGIGTGLGGLVGMLINMRRDEPSRIGGILAGVLGLVGGVVATLNLPSGPPSIEAQLESAGPAFIAIHRYYPEVFAQMAADAKAVERKDRAALIRPRLSALVAAHRSEMDDTSVNALGRLMLDETQALKSSNPLACVAVLGGGPATADMGSAFSPELGRRDSEVIADILTQVATRPATPPQKLTAPEANAIIDAALGELSADERQLVVPLLLAQKAPAAAGEARAYCAFYRNLFITSLRGPDQTLRRFLTH